VSYLDELNDIQRQAVEHITGPAMIIAGPGSGKTRVLTYRIAHLIELGIDPFNILSLTFTNKAAKEMTERIEKIAGGEARNLYIGTFHSVFARLLRYDGSQLGYPSNFSIYDTQDSRNMIKSIVKERGLNKDLYKPNMVHNRISQAKNMLMSPMAYFKHPDIKLADEMSGRPRTGELYVEYAKRCFRAGAMDFDDILFNMYNLITKFPDILYKYQQQFKFVMVDEFQDTNVAQYAIIKKISAAHENISVVGDDAQSIYAFRGATIQNILNFQKDYPDLKVYKLEQNYRSTKHIVNIANVLIKKNQGQLQKTIWTDNAQGSNIKVFCTASDNDEARKVTDSIHEETLRNHFKNKEIAILYRTNAQSRAMEDALRKRNIQYQVYGGTSFYQRKEVKDMLAYLKLLVNHKDEEALKRVVNYPTRGISTATMQQCALIANDRDISLWEVLNDITNADFKFKPRVQSSVSAFTTLIKSYATLLNKKDAYYIAAEMAKESGMAPKLHNDKTVEGISRFDNFQELLNSIKEFTEADEVGAIGADSEDKGLGSYLQQVMLATDQDKNVENKDTVKLMTIHAAKGLEFAVVYVIGLEEELFPSKMSMNIRENLEEERRLFYVAVTRAEKKLYLSYAANRYKFGKLVYPEPSRFLEELPVEALEYIGRRKKQKSAYKPNRSSGHNLKPKRPAQKVPFSNDPNFRPSDVSKISVGTKVRHQRFGSGTVIDIEGVGKDKIATVTFSQLGQKRILLKFAKLQILDA